MDEGTSKGNALLGQSVFDVLGKGGMMPSDGVGSVLKAVNSSFDRFFQQQRDLKSNDGGSSSSVSTETYAESVAAEVAQKVSESIGASSSSSSETDSSETAYVTSESAASETAPTQGLAESIGVTASDSFVKMINDGNRKSEEIAEATNVETANGGRVDELLKELSGKIDAVDARAVESAGSPSVPEPPEKPDQSLFSIGDVLSRGMDTLLQLSLIHI